MSGETTFRLGTLFLIPNSLAEESLYEGYLSDLRRVLNGLNLIFAENEKNARRAIRRCAPERSLADIEIIPLDEHSRSEDFPQLLQPMLAGKDAGILSEAGCPCVADPGAELVRLAHKHGIRVCSLVGPSSLLLALMASGLNGQSFVFLGYLPRDSAERKKRIREIEEASRRNKQTQIFIETPYRNDALLKDILASCRGDTDLCLAVSLTGPRESVATRTISTWKHDAPTIGKVPAVFLLLAY